MRLFFCLALCSAVSAADIRISDFVLSDQFGRSHEQCFPREEISIFVLADRKGSAELKGWITPFQERYDDRVNICGVAFLKGVPGLIKPAIRRLFRKERDYPVLLDWSGGTCDAFGYVSGRADIFVVAGDGTVMHRTSGEANEEKLEACFKIIDERINPASGPPESVSGTDEPKQAEGLPVQESKTGE